MVKYSITLNFFVPEEVSKAMKDVEIRGNLGFDWRKSNCHCTVKIISLPDEMPSKEIIAEWVSQTKAVLDNQEPFKVAIKGISQFPTALYAKVYSDDLIRLHKKLFKVLPSGYPQFENENYTPHASIGILEKGVEVLSDKEQDFGEFEVKEIQLIIWDIKDQHKPMIQHRFRLV